MNVLNIAVWLRVQLDEDERRAPLAAEIMKSRATTRPFGNRLLADIEAKRMLLLQFELRGNSVRATVQPSTGGVWDDLLRILALPYADRDGYREEWRP